MRKLNARMRLEFDDIEAENGDAAKEAVEQAIVQMQEHCRSEMAAALESVGARLYKMEIIVF